MTKTKLARYFLSFFILPFSPLLHGQENFFPWLDIGHQKNQNNKIDSNQTGHIDSLIKISFLKKVLANDFNADSLIDSIFTVETGGQVFEIRDQDFDGVPELIIEKRNFENKLLTLIWEKWGNSFKLKEWKVGNLIEAQGLGGGGAPVSNYPFPSFPNTGPGPGTSWALLEPNGGPPSLSAGWDRQSSVAAALIAPGYFFLPPDRTEEIKMIGKPLEVEEVPGPCKASASTQNELKQMEGFYNLFAEDVGRGLLQNNGYQMTSLGVAINKNCYEKFPATNFDKALQDSLREGVSCLWELNGTVSREAALRIQTLLLGGFSDPPLLDCPDSYSGTGAAQSTLPPKPPYIELNVTAFKNEEFELQFKDTYFHELLHNAGYDHGNGYEMSYTCGQCCFGSQISSKLRQSACRACGTKAISADSEEYAREILEYYELAQPGIGVEFAFQYLLKHRNSQWAYKYLIDDHWSIDPNFNVGLAEVLGVNFTPKKKYAVAPEFYQEAIKSVANSYKCVFTEEFINCFDSLKEPLLLQAQVDLLDENQIKNYAALLYLKGNLLFKIAKQLEIETSTSEKNKEDSFDLEKKKSLINEIKNTLLPELKSQRDKLKIK